MPDLKSRFRGVDQIPSPDLWPEIAGRQSRVPSPEGGPWRRLGTVAVAFAVAAAGIALAARAFLSDRPQSTRMNPPAAVAPRVTATIPTGHFPQAIAAGFGSVWVTVPKEDWSGGLVQRIDPAANAIVAEIPIEDGEMQIATGLGSVWVASVTKGTGPQGETSDFGGVLYRIDPTSDRVVAEIPFQGGLIYDLAVDDAGVWMAQATGNRTGVVLHVDPLRGEVVASIPVDDSPYSIVTGEGYVWVLLGPRGLVKIDPTTDRVVAVIDANPVAFEMTVGDGAVWVQSWLSAHDPSVNTGSEDRLVALRVDAQTNEVGEPVVIEGGFEPIVSTYGGVWFLTGHRGVVARLDPQTLEVDAEVGLPSEDRESRNFAAFEETTESIWIANDRGGVIRIDLLPNKGPSTASPTPQPSPAPSLPADPGWYFYAPTYRDGDRVVMPVTFPDGTRMELLYPPSLDLAEFGIGPNTYGSMPGTGCGGNLLIRAFDAKGEIFEGEEPIAEFQTAAGGRAELWPGKESSPGNWLAFQFGHWQVLVWCPTSRERALQGAEQWASALKGEETDDGFLILTGRAPLKLAGMEDRPHGPELFIEGGSGHTILVLAPAADCGAASYPGNVWCIEGESSALVVSAFGDDKEFIESVMNGLEVRGAPSP